VGDDPDGTQFPAAADNAFGVAVVIEAALRLHRSLPAVVGLAWRSWTPRRPVRTAAPGTRRRCRPVRM
jgi:Zn-dependent M28 family amino/carboxypeptidase